MSVFRPQSRHWVAAEFLLRSGFCFLCFHIEAHFLLSHTPGKVSFLQAHTLDSHFHYIEIKTNNLSPISPPQTGDTTGISAGTFIATYIVSGLFCSLHATFSWPGRDGFLLCSPKYSCVRRFPCWSILLRQAWPRQTRLC